MRRDVLQLRSFYAGRLGQAARDMILRKLVEAWGAGQGLDMLGLGYASPYLDAFRGRARRAIAAMPAGQGVERWPMGERGLACLAPERRLPFPDALFDRILMVHALEESDDPHRMMAEARRVLAPGGRLIVVVSARSGLWCHAEHTPFGHGRPYTRGQLEAVVRAAGLEPAAWSRALYAPPLALFAPWAEAVEHIGAVLAAPASGVVMLEAVKQTFAVRPQGAVAPARLRPALSPAPAGARKLGLSNRDELRHR